MARCLCRTWSVRVALPRCEPTTDTSITLQNKFDGGGNITVEEAVTKACVRHPADPRSPGPDPRGARRTKNVFLAAKPEWNGKFVDYEGETVPW